MNFSFGIQLEPQFGYNKKDIDNIAEQVQKSPVFDTIWISDHMFLNEEAVNKSAFDCFTLMTYLLTKYQEIRVGSLVLCNSYRHPAILAKMITTLDYLSGGRIEVGYGAGWKHIEYQAYGIDFPSVSERIERLAEGIEILKKLWSPEEKVSFSGKYYQLNQAICYPKPLQKPHPRLWIGTMYGKDKMLRLIAKHGDGINLAWSFTVEQLKRIFSKVNSYCSEYQRDPTTLAKSVGFWVRIYNDKEEMLKKMTEEAKKRKMTLEQVKNRTKGALIGTKEEVIKKLKDYLNLGISHYIFMFPYGEESKYIKIFNDEIIPKVV